MKYAIIPDYMDVEKSLELSKEYHTLWEYNDFLEPDIYGDSDKLKQRISYYEGLHRPSGTDTMHGAFLGLDIAALDPVIRERSRELCKQSLEIARKLKLKGVVFHTGLIGGLRVSYYLENWLKAAEEFWGEKCRNYPELIIYMENSFEQEPDIFVKLMERMKEYSNFRICLDYAHAVITATPIEIWMEKLARYISHMHINDNDLKNDLHLVPGDGQIDYRKWYELYEKYQIRGTVLLELKGNDEIKRALDYMKKEEFQ